MNTPVIKKDMTFVYERTLTVIEIMGVASKDAMMTSFKSNEPFKTITLRLSGGVWNIQVIVTSEVFTVLLLNTVRFQTESDLRIIKEIFHLDITTKDFGTEYYDITHFVDLFVALDKLEGGY